jgi:hypothetical protein
MRRVQVAERGKIKKTGERKRKGRERKDESSGIK